MTANRQTLSPAIRGFLVDMDGTFYLSDRLLPGAAAFLDYTLAAGIQVLFLSNNSSRNQMAYVDKIKAMGLNIPP